MSKRAPLTTLALALALIGAMVVLHLNASPEDSATPGFTKATAVTLFSFPRDHSAHPGYQTEWWYYTGILRDRERNIYGFELTFFRVGIVPKLVGRSSAWAARDVLFAHFAVTDVSRGRFHFFEATGRPVLGLAGYSADELDVFIGDWFVRDEGGKMRLSASRDGFGIDLELIPERSPVANGKQGLSIKGPGQGNANYYYSVARLATRGAIRAGAAPVDIQGFTWMDHEWGTSELTPNQKGWDWFSLRLSDGRDLMIYVLRDLKGNATPYSSGTITGVDGKTSPLDASDFRISVLGRWKSSRTRASYPSRWRIEIPEYGIDLTVTPLVADQELVTSGTTRVSYWEGAVSAKGPSLSGEGYVEMTGYAGESPSGFTRGM